MAAREGRNRLALGFLDQGAGPREFWQNVSAKRNHETFKPRRTAGPNPNLLAKMEGHMWRLALVVRCHDRAKGLRLRRHEAQRKLLDMRLYELLLLYMQHTLLDEGAIVEARNGSFSLVLGHDAPKNLGALEGDAGLSHEQVRAARERTAGGRAKLRKEDARGGLYSSRVEEMLSRIA